MREVLIIGSPIRRGVCDGAIGVSIYIICTRKAARHLQQNATGSWHSMNALMGKEQTAFEVDKAKIDYDFGDVQLPGRSVATQGRTSP